MVDQIGQTPLPIQPVPSTTRPAVKNSQTAPAAPIPAEAGDRSHVSDLAQAASRSGDVDIEVNFGHEGATLQGQVLVSPEEIKNDLTKALQGSDDVSNIAVSHDPATGTYHVSGQYKLPLVPDASFSFDVKPQVRGGDLRLKIFNFSYPLPEMDFIDKRMVKSIGEQFQQQGLLKNVFYDRNLIELDSQALIKQHTDPLVGKVDWKRQDTRLEMDQQGNLRVSFAEQGHPTAPGETATLHPSVRIKMDRDHILQELNQRFGGKEVKFSDVQMQDNALKVKADVSYYSTGTALAGLFGLLLLAGSVQDPNGREVAQSGVAIVGAAGANRQHRDAQVDMEVAGHRLTISTSDHRALDDMVEYLQKKGITARQEGNQLIMDDLRAAVPELKEVKAIHITPEELIIEGRR